MLEDAIALNRRRAVAAACFFLSSGFRVRVSITWNHRPLTESLFMPDIDRESKSALPRTGRLASPSPLLSSTVDASLTADTEPPRSSPHPNDDRAS